MCVDAELSTLPPPAKTSCGQHFAFHKSIRVSSSGMVCVYILSSPLPSSMGLIASISEGLVRGERDCDAEVVDAGVVSVDES